MVTKRQRERIEKMARGIFRAMAMEEEETLEDVARLMEETDLFLNPEQEAILAYSMVCFAPKNKLFPPSDA